MKERVYVFDNLKFILIWLVVLGHSVEPFVDEVPVLKSMFIFIYTFHMPAFIFITGLFAAKTVADPVKCRAKITSFLLFYLILKILYSIVHYILKGEFSFHIFYEAGLPWFIFATALCFAVTRFLKDLPILPLFIGSILFACLCGYDQYINDYFCLSRFIVYYPFFVAGYGIGHKKMTEICNTLRMKLCGAVVILLLFYVCFFKCDLIYPFRPLVTGRNPFQTLMKSMENGSELFIYGGLYRFIYYGILFLILFSLIALMTNKKIICTKMGERTLAVYILHMFVLIWLRNTSFYVKMAEHFQGSLLLLCHICFSLLIVIFFSLKIWMIPLHFLENLIGKKWEVV